VGSLFTNLIFYYSRLEAGVAGTLGLTMGMVLYYADLSGFSVKSKCCFFFDAEFTMIKSFGRGYFTLVKNSEQSSGEKQLLRVYTNDRYMASSTSPRSS
jgi:hypothetical protein